MVTCYIDGYCLLLNLIFSGSRNYSNYKNKIRNSISFALLFVEVALDSKNKRMTQRKHSSVQEQQIYPWQIV